jgi:hypothetical protein
MSTEQNDDNVEPGSEVAHADPAFDVAGDQPLAAEDDDD